MVSPSMVSGTTTLGRSGSGRVISSQLSSISFADRGTVAPSTSTSPESIMVATVVRLIPNNFASPASSRIPVSPLGTGSRLTSGTVVRFGRQVLGIFLRGLFLAGAGAVEIDAAQRGDHQAD